MSVKKHCFIIMPITTPEIMVDQYPDGEEHFQHVLNSIFEPAVEKAGFEPIPPKARGSDIIHAEIINCLVEANLVLCDMSCLNPNVFFEWGCRTALNKPVCIVKDELTTNIPFDIAILNYHEYKSSPSAWEIASEIERLAAHIRESAGRSTSQNALWKYFGISSEVTPARDTSDSSEKLELSKVARDILGLCLHYDVTSINMEDPINDLPHSRIQIESAIDELRSAGLFRQTSTGGFSGPVYSLTESAKRLLAKIDPSKK